MCGRTGALSVSCTRCLRPQQDERETPAADHDDDQPPIFADQIHSISPFPLCVVSAAKLDRDKRAPTRKESPGARRSRLRRSAARRRRRRPGGVFDAGNFVHEPATSSPRWKSSAGPESISSPRQRPAMQMRADLRYLVVDERLRGPRFDLGREAVGSAERPVPQSAAEGDRQRRAANAQTVDDCACRRLPECDQPGDYSDDNASSELAARNRSRRRSRFLPRKLAPADIAAVKAVGEIDLVDGAIGARPGVGERFGDGRDGKHPAALWRQALHRRARCRRGRRSRPRPVRPLRSSRISAAAGRRARVTARRDDHGHRMLSRKPRLHRSRRGARSPPRGAAPRNRPRSAA